MAFKYKDLKKSIPTPRILNQYLNQPVKRLKEALGLIDKNVLEVTTFSDMPVSLKKLEDKSFTVGGFEYDTYSFKAWTVLGDANSYAEAMGIINVSDGFMLITKQSSNIAADDTTGPPTTVGGFTNGAIANSGTLVEDNDTSIVAPATLLYVNQDTTISGVDDNWMFLIASAPTLTTLDCEVYVDIEFVVDKGVKVTLL